MDPFLPIAGAPPRAPAPIPRDAALHAAATKLETAFLAEMLKSMGMGKPSDMFGGGPGEDQFQSFMVEAQAEKLANAGGIGLAQSLFEALKEREA